jgi:hypothetical protein
MMSAVPDSFNRCIRRLSGGERFQVHQLRHTFAGMRLEPGENLVALQFTILTHVSARCSVGSSNVHPRGPSERVLVSSAPPCRFR